MGRRALFAATSFVGVVLAHALCYVSPVAGPHGGHSPSHEHFHLLVTAACLLVPFILLLGVRGALRGHATLPMARVGMRIGGLQVAGFALLELVERDLHVGETFTDPAVIAGLVLQLLVAVVLVWLLARLAQVVATIAARLRRAPPTSRRPAPPTPVWRAPAPRAPLLRQLLGRAPPLAL